MKKSLLTAPNNSNICNAVSSAHLSSWIGARIAFIQRICCYSNRYSGYYGEYEMSAIDLLQQLGLNKYEAEAYYTLLRQGPLTGYELGKRSQVPLSRSYEILERLTQQGLALIQPGDPPRYMAQDAQQFLAQIRSEMEETLTALATSLASLSRADTAGEFWVVRGYRHIYTREGPDNGGGSTAEPSPQHFGCRSC
jgi:predicted transcriptional regulator